MPAAAFCSLRLMSFSAAAPAAAAAATATQMRVCHQVRKEGDTSTSRQS
jgi:hypothetical protein